MKGEKMDKIVNNEIVEQVKKAMPEEESLMMLLNYSKCLVIQQEYALFVLYLIMRCVFMI